MENFFFPVKEVNVNNVSLEKTMQPFPHCDFQV